MKVPLLSYPLSFKQRLCISQCCVVSALPSCLLRAAVYCRRRHLPIFSACPSDIHPEEWSAPFKPLDARCVVSSVRPEDDCVCSLYTLHTATLLHGSRLLTLLTYCIVFSLAGPSTRSAGSRAWIAVHIHIVHVHSFMISRACVCACTCLPASSCMPYHFS